MFILTFYLRRFIRIWLPWFFAFLASIFARRFFFSHPVTQPALTPWFNDFWNVDMTVSDFLRQCAFILHDATRQLLNQDWSLGVELKGSALIPLFLICARPRNVAFMFPLAILFLLLVGTGHYYVSFMLGVLAAQYGCNWIQWLGRQPKYLRVGFFVIGLVFYQVFGWACHFYPNYAPAGKYGWVVTAVGCFMILISVLGSQTLQRILNHKVAVFLGRISYSVYLLQFIIILCLLPPLVALLNKMGIYQPGILFSSTIIVGVAATIGCAAIMYRWVELPVINFGHWFSKKIQQRFGK